VGLLCSVDASGIQARIASDGRALFHRPVGRPMSVVLEAEQSMQMNAESPALEYDETLMRCQDYRVTTENAGIPTGD